MSDRNPSNELLELLKSQSRSAKDWSYSIAGAFWQNKGQIIDEEYLFTCLANAMMSMHDSIFNEEIKQLEQELQKTREQLENKGTKIQELTALIVNYMGMTKVEKEKYYEVVLTFSKQEKIEHSVRKILNALDNQLEQELQKTKQQLNKAEKVISADVGYNVFEFHKLRDEYFKDKDKQGE